MSSPKALPGSGSRLCWLIMHSGRLSESRHHALSQLRAYSTLRARCMWRNWSGLMQFVKFRVVALAEILSTFVECHGGRASGALAYHDKRDIIAPINDRRYSFGILGRGSKYPADLFFFGAVAVIESVWTRTSNSSGNFQNSSQLKPICASNFSISTMGTCWSGGRSISG